MNHSEYIRTKSLWTRAYISLCFVYLFTMITVHMGNNSLTLYIDSLGLSPNASGLMASVFAVVACAVRPLVGRICDHVNKHTVICCGGVIVALAAIGLMHIVWFPAMVFFRAIQGIGFSVACTAAGAAVADTVPRERLGEGLGYYGLGGAISMALGPMIGLSLISYGGYDLMFWGLCGTGVLTVLSAMLSKNKTAAFIPRRPQYTQAEPQFSEHFPWNYIERSALPGALLQLLTAVSFCGMCTFMTLYAADRPFANVSIFFLVTAAAMIAGRIITGNLFDRFGALTVLLPGYMVQVVTLYLLAVAHNAALFYMAAVLHGIVLGTLPPCFNAIALMRVEPTRRGAASATYHLFYDAGQALGNCLWGMMLTAYGFNKMFILAAVLIIPTVFLTLSLLKNTKLIA